jgi:hypothetical protein
MADQKITDLTAIDALATGDLFAVVDDPAGTPASKKATINQVQDYIEAAANSFTAAQTITPTSDAPALTVRRNSDSQTSKVFQVQTEANAALADIDKDGKLSVVGATINGGTVTTSSPVIDAAQTWNDGAVTFTGLKFNATDTASTNSSMLLDLQVGGNSRASIYKAGAFLTASYISNFSSASIFDPSSGLTLSNSHFVRWSSSAGGFATSDLFLTRRAAANLRFGAADAAAPVAQTLSVQSVVAGTTNTAGANLTITGSQGTGTGAGGSIVFQVAPAGSSGTAQNALATAVDIRSGGLMHFGGEANSYIGNSGAGPFLLITSLLGIGYTTSTIRMSSAASFGFTGSTVTTSLDTILARDAANTLALRNGANAQAFNVYNTFTDASNYERGFAKWSANVFQIGTEAAGSGSNRNFEIWTAGARRLFIGATGTPYSEFFTASLYIGSNVGFNATSSGVLTLYNYLANDFGRLNFGGTTSSFPALKRSTTTLQARLADDSAFTNIQGKITTETAYTAGAPTATGYLVLYDSNGTAYKVAAEAL